MPTKQGAVRPEKLFRIYELAKAGYKPPQIADLVKISRHRLKSLLTKDEQVRRAYDYGKSQYDFPDSGAGTLRGYVYGMLPDDLKLKWDEIVNLDKIGDLTPDKVEKIICNQDLVRKHLFFHALISTLFNVSEACRLVNMKVISYRKLAQDRDFARLVKEFVFHKKNFVEGALFKLIEQGDSAAIIFANKCLNRDRGYADKMTVEHKHEHEHQIRMDVLDSLDLETKKKILMAYRAKQLPAHIDDVPEADYTVVDINDPRDEK